MSSENKNEEQSIPIIPSSVTPTSSRKKSSSISSEYLARIQEETNRIRQKRKQSQQNQTSIDLDLDRDRRKAADQKTLAGSGYSADTYTDTYTDTNGTAGLFVPAKAATTLARGSPKSGIKLITTTTVHTSQQQQQQQQQQQLYILHNNNNNNNNNCLTKVLTRV
jgi:hypothetical protein